MRKTTRPGMVNDEPVLKRLKQIKDNQIGLHLQGDSSGLLGSLNPAFNQLLASSFPFALTQLPQNLTTQKNMLLGSQFVDTNELLERFGGDPMGKNQNIDVDLKKKEAIKQSKSQQQQILDWATGS